MMFKWFDTREVDALAERMIREFKERLPSASFETGGKTSEARRRKGHDVMLEQAREFAGERKLNIYQKSRLANRVKWALLEAGYPKPFVDELAYELATVIALAAKGKQ